VIREPFPNCGSIGIWDATDDVAMLFSLRTSQGNEDYAVMLLMIRIILVFAVEDVDKVIGNCPPDDHRLAISPVITGVRKECPRRVSMIPWWPMTCSILAPFGVY
jgi:hypothetical protein